MVKNSVKLLAVFLIATSIFGTVCFGAVPAEAAGNHPFTPGATINVMIMPQGDMNSATVKEVTTAVNNRIKALGYNFKVKFSFSGGAWGFEALDEALSSGNNIPDIFPSHSWSGVFSYANAAKEGFLLRLDDPKDNLLTQFGSKLYGNASYTVKEAASVIGKQGYGTYGYIIEKDSVSQNGYLVNETVLKQLGFTLADINPKDISSWDPILKAYKKKYPNKYPLNVEADVMDRANNYIAFVDGSVSTLGYFFSGTDKANKIQSRYESNAYKSYLSQMQKFYKAGYIHPDLAITGETSSYRIAATRESGDYLISTFVYVPGYETVYSQSATYAQGKNIVIKFISPWDQAIGTSETAQGSGLAVNAGTQYVAESVTFLNLLASDKTIGDLVAEGIKGKSYNVVDGAIYRTEDRAGWSIWRYGIVGDTSGATPFWSTDEWTDMKSFNDSAAALPIAGWLFDRSSVDEEVGRCTAIIDKYCIALGVGASNKYNAFIAELKAAGIDKVVKEAQRQYAAYAAVANAARKVDTQYISMRLNSAKAIYSENNNFKVISADPNNAKVAPFTLLGKTMVPVRFLTNFTGVKVKYDSKTMGTTLSYKGITLTLALNAKTMKKVVGKATTNVTLSTPATMVEGKTYIPMRAVAEALGFSVKYDSLSDVIVVSESKLKGAEYDIVNNAGKLELPAGRITIATISAAKTTLSLKKGQSQSLTKSDIIFKPSNASCKLLTYKSSNTKVAEVSTVGKITAKAKGTATITITSNNGKTAKITVKVS